MLKRCIGPLLAILFIGTASVAKAEDRTVWTEYPESGVVLGQGYSLLEDRPATGTCVDFVPVQDPSQSIQYRFDEVTSNTEVRSVTSISASGSMKMAILKASARLSFLADESFKLETQKFLLTASVVNSALFAAPSLDFKQGGNVVGQKLPDGSAGKDYSSFNKISLKDDSDIFNSEKCGQGFVAAIVSGASLDAFLTMSKSDAESLADAKGSLEADIGGVFSVSGSFEQKRTSSDIQAHTSVSVFKTGGAGGQIAYDLPGLKTAVAGMPLEAATTPKPIKIGIVPYEYLDKIPQSKSYSALLFEQAVEAYFLVNDVFHNTGSAIDSYEKYSEEPEENQPIYLKPLATYVDLNARSLRSANQLSKILALCQGQVAEAGRAVSNQKTADLQASKLVEISTAIGVQPFQESKRRGSRTIKNASSAGKNADALFQDALNGLDAGKPADEITLAAEGNVDKLKFCNTEGDDSYLNRATDEAIGLAAEELKMRPIFWADLGVKYREKLRSVAERVGGPETVAAITADAAPILKEFGDDYRASRMLRGICNRSFAHPICGVDYNEFVKSASPDISEGDVNLPQLAVDAARK